MQSIKEKISKDIYLKKYSDLINKIAKVEYHSIPYHNITHFAVESAGNFDLDAELKIWVNGMGTEAITQKFSTDTNIYKIQALLAAYVMG